MTKVAFPLDRMNRREAAAYLGFSESTLAADARTGVHGVPFVRLGRKVFYLRSHLDKWLSRHGV